MYVFHVLAHFTIAFFTAFFFFVLISCRKEVNRTLLQQENIHGTVGFISRQTSRTLDEGQSGHHVQKVVARNANNFFFSFLVA